MADVYDTRIVLPLNPDLLWLTQFYLEGEATIVILWALWTYLHYVIILLFLSDVENRPKYRKYLMIFVVHNVIGIIFTGRNEVVRGGVWSGGVGVWSGGVLSPPIFYLFIFHLFIFLKLFFWIFFWFLLWFLWGPLPQKQTQAATEQPVRILLECILVLHSVLFKKMRYPLKKIGNRKFKLLSHFK